MQNISYTVHTFKEDEIFVAYVPEFDVSSCGATEAEARKNIEEAVQGFLETSAEMGFLEEILEESGYTRDNGSWRAPELVSIESAVARVA